MMGIAGLVVWDRMDSDKEGVKKQILFMIQLALNASYLFFGLRNPMLAGWKLLFCG
jgi:tryptophan-rich sensory protein